MKLIFALAMDYEIKNIFDTDDWEYLRREPFHVLVYKKNKDIGIIRTGIGKANAAAATQFALTTYTPEKIINLGTVGSLNTTIPIGDVRQISECQFFDVDVTVFGYALGQIPQCDLATYTLKINAKHRLPLAKATSGDTFVTDPTIFKKVMEQFSPDFVDMELSAIAHTLHINKCLDILESYKVPSDYSNRSSTNDFYANEKMAFQNLKTFAADLLTQ